MTDIKRKYTVGSDPKYAANYDKIKWSNKVEMRSEERLNWLQREHNKLVVEAFKMKKKIEKAEYIISSIGLNTSCEMHTRIEQWLREPKEQD